jgi:hypothetical protein
MHRQPVHVPAPAIPRRDQSAHDELITYGEEESAVVALEQLLESVAIVGLAQSASRLLP